MKVYVLCDLHGDTKVVGVVSSEVSARRWKEARDQYYRRWIPCDLDELSPRDAEDTAPR
jgi:hypothetical protein